MKNSPILGEPKGLYPVTIGGSSGIDIVTVDVRISANIERINTIAKIYLILMQHYTDKVC